MPLELATKEEMKTKAIAWLIHFWYVVVIIISLGGCVWLWQGNVSKQKKIDDLVAITTVQKTIDELDAQLKEMEERKKLLYPAVEKKQKELEALQAALEKQRKDLPYVKRDKIAKEVDKMDLNALNNEFGRLGYAGKIVSTQ